MNLVLPSFHGETLENTLTVPLIVIKFKETMHTAKFPYTEY